MQLVLILCLLSLANVCIHADIASGAPTTIVVHNAPDAVSHQSFTRRLTSSQQRQFNPVSVHNHLQLPTYSAQHVHPPAAHAVVTPPHVGNYYGAKLILGPTEPPAYAAFARRHTPAHLTFAASPVIHQMLPRIKPVRKISYDKIAYLPA